MALVSVVAITNHPARVQCDEEFCTASFSLDMTPEPMLLKPCLLFAYLMQSRSCLIRGVQSFGTEVYMAGYCGVSTEL